MKSKIIKQLSLVFTLLCISVSLFAQKPNIVVILADDLGNADVGYNGHQSEVPTPNIDALVADGAKFTAGYVTAPVCGPSRAGLLTGKYQQSFGFEDNPGPFRAAPDVIAGIPLSVKMIGEYFKPLGYNTACFGKWHVGGEESDDMLPANRGFDEFYGFLGGAANYLPEDNDDEKMLRGNAIAEHQDGYLTDIIADEANDFITRNQSTPFMMYIAFNAVHGPLQAPDDLLELYSHIEPEGRRKLCAMQHSMDVNIGKVLAKLSDLDLEDNTLIFFLSDNGGIPGGNYSYNTPYKGEKGQVYEGGIRLPFAIKWPGNITAGSSYDKPVNSLDILPTALAAAGEDLTNYPDLHGVDLTPYVTGANTADPHDYLFWKLNSTKWAVRNADYKLVDNGDTDNPMLFNISSDIGSENDLYSSMPDKVAELKAKYDEWEATLMPAQWGWQTSVGEYVKHHDEDFEKVVKTQFNQLGGGVSEFVENPNKSGINTSNTVLKITLADQAQDWSGGWASAHRFQKKYRYVHVKVLKERTTPVRFKVEGDGGANYTAMNINDYSNVGEWQDLVFDVDFYAAVTKFNIQPDYITDGSATVVYIDDIWYSDDPTPRGAAFGEIKPIGLTATDITSSSATISWDAIGEAVSYQVYKDGNLLEEVTTNSISLSNLQSDGIYNIHIVGVNNMSEQTMESDPFTLMMPDYAYVICDFDTKSETFEILGSTVISVTANPDKSGINTSDNVLKIERLAGNTTNWAGTWSDVENFEPQLRYIHMMVYKEKISTVRFKLEGSSNMVKESSNTQTLTGEWEDMVFDFESFSSTVNKVNIQPDFVTTGDAHVIYIDDIIMSNDPEPRTETSTSISETDLKGKTLKVYPVPVDDVLYIKDSKYIEGNVSVLDNAGRAVIQVDKQDAITGINVQSLTNGMYFISCQYKGDVQTVKITKY